MDKIEDRQNLQEYVTVGVRNPLIERMVRCQSCKDLMGAIECALVHLGTGSEGVQDAYNELRKISDKYWAEREEEQEDKRMCDCGWKGKSNDLKEVVETRYCCPECEEDTEAVCDMDGCWRPGTCGIPTKSGYRWTCSEHRPEDETEGGRH